MTTDEIERDPAADDGWFDDDEEDDLDLFEDDCGEMDDGTCMYAGSEYCDFECPLERLRARALNPKGGDNGEG